MEFLSDWPCVLISPAEAWVHTKPRGDWGSLQLIPSSFVMRMGPTPVLLAAVTAPLAAASLVSGLSPLRCTRAARSCTVVASSKDTPLNGLFHALGTAQTTAARVASAFHLPEEGEAATAAAAEHMATTQNEHAQANHAFARHAGEIAAKLTAPPIQALQATTGEIQEAVEAARAAAQAREAANSALVYMKSTAEHSRRVLKETIQAVEAKSATANATWVEAMEAAERATAEALRVKADGELEVDPSDSHVAGGCGLSCACSADVRARLNPMYRWRRWSLPSPK